MGVPITSLMSCFKPVTLILLFINANMKRTIDNMHGWLFYPHDKISQKHTYDADRHAIYIYIYKKKKKKKKKKGGGINSMATMLSNRFRDLRQWKQNLQYS